MKKTLSKLFFPIFILFLVGFLAWKNYAPDTFLTGWDNLHPEYNFSLYFKRVFYGAWQEHQGIGAPAAQSHAAELSRLPVIYALSLILPQNLARYSFFFLTLAFGAVGMYFLTRFFLYQHPGRYKSASAFLAACFYVLNLATLQQFFTPLEMFAVHFASLPWLLLFAIKYLKSGKQKMLFVFSLVALFSSSMAHTATLFYVFFFSFSAFVILVMLLVRKKEVIKRGFLLLVATVVLNLFWLGPNIYYVTNESSTVANSKINQTFSDEAYLQSRSFGNLTSLGLLKNFSFNWREYDYSSGSFEDLMGVWENHLSRPGVQVVGYGFFVLAAFGALIALFRKDKYALSLFPIAVLSIFFWLNGIPREFVLLREALRFPFTKFSILLIATLSVYLAYSTQFLVSVFGKIKFGYLVTALGVLALIYFMLPAFTGNFIDKTMKVGVPSEYFEAFDWFDRHNPSGRVAKLPLQTFWDWNFYSWGYQGGGFTWFGISQPTLDREFDRWGRFNEDFYFQASGALYGNEPDMFLLTLKKYQVKYLLLDESVINPSGSPNLLYFTQIKDILSRSTDLREVAKFGFLSIYETDFDVGNNFVSAPQEEIVNSPPALTKAGLITNEDLSVNRGFPAAYNCDLKKIGTVSKENSSQGILYKADGGGVSCDYLNYPDLKYNQGYVIHVVGENITGRSLKIYFTNFNTQRADIEELLPPGKFDKEFYVYPSKLGGAGYSLNFETRSYGQIASENLVTKVEIYGATPSIDLRGEYTVNNSLKIREVKKYGTWAYKVDVEGYGLIMLGQGYEEGWLGLKLDGSILTVLPHKIFNSWANAWDIPPGQSRSTVYVIYWPQLLEWGGMFLGILSLLTLLRRRL